MSQVNPAALIALGFAAGVLATLFAVLYAGTWIGALAWRWARVVEKSGITIAITQPEEDTTAA